MSERIIPLFSGFRLIQNEDVYPLSTDTVLLSSFARPDPAGECCDLGTGGGAALLLLLARYPVLRGTGIEIDPATAATARRNLALNGVADRASIITGDFRTEEGMPAPGSVSLVLSNPPYFERTRGLHAPRAVREAARGDTNCTIDALCRAAARLLPTGGRFCLVWRTERLCDLIAALRDAHLEPKRMRLVQTRVGAAPRMLLCEAVRGGGAGLSCEAPLILHSDDGGYTEETRAIYAGSTQYSSKEARP